MHQGPYNLISIGHSRRGMFSRVMVHFLIYSLIIAQPASATSASKVMSFPEMVYLVGLIKATNDAMAQASLNPQNKNYRDNVRRAVSMLPAGIIAVAGVFKSNKLHDKDLPLVQSILGGFVDVNAPDRYKAFFKKPDASLIPKTGTNFPQNAKPVDINSGAVDSGPGKAEAPAVAASTAPVPPSNDIVSLQENWVPNRTAPEPRGNKDLKSYAYDESNKKAESGGNGSLGDVGNVGGNGGIVAAPASGGGVGATASFGYSEEAKGAGFQQEMSAEFNSVESRLTSASNGTGLGEAPVNRVQYAQPTELDREKENFFAKGKQARSEEEGDELEVDDKPTIGKKLKKKRFKGDPKRELARDSKAPLKPKFWRTSVISGFLDAYINEAKAQGGGGQGQCQDCGGQQSGGSAAEILMGIAAIIAAIAPMVVAAIQAEADKAIAKINADTTLKTAQMQADTSKYLANVQKDVALQQTAISQQIAKQNNDGQTQRLNMQLAELRSAREDAQKAEQEKRQIEMQYNQERIALAKKQADDNLKLAKETLNANLTQAGLVSGVVSKNSANSLSVAKAGLTTSSSNSALASNGTATGGLANAGGGSSVGNGIPSMSGGAASTTPGGGATGLGVIRAASTPTLTTTRVADRLLEAVASPRKAMSDEEREEELRHSKRASRNVRLARGVRNGSSRGVVSADEQRVSTQLASNLATGSTAGRGFKMPSSDGKSTLGEFRNQNTKDETWYDPAPRQSAPRELASSGTGGGHSAQPVGRGALSNAYRAPDLGD